MTRLIAVVVLGWWFAVVVMAGCTDPVKAEMTAAEISEATGQISGDEIDRAIAFHGAHHAEFYQGPDGAAWFIVDADGVVLARLAITE